MIRIVYGRTEMNILVVGGGGREHAIIKKLRENKDVEKIYALPGNGGIGRDAECVAVKATDIDGIVAFAKKVQPDYAVVAPDDPRVMGCVDALTSIGIPCFGPEAKAAVIEGSKRRLSKRMVWRWAKALSLLRPEKMPKQLSAK